MHRNTTRRGLRARVHSLAAGAVALALAATGLTTVAATADETSEIAGLLELSRPELAAIKEKVEAGDESGAAEELKSFYAQREGIAYPSAGEGGAGEASAEEIAAGTFRYSGETRDFYDSDQQRIDVDWTDTWGGTEESPGGAQVLMTDFTFLPMLTRAYQQETDPQQRAIYAGAWMEISLDFFADMPEWPRNRNLSAAKRLTALVDSFSVFRSEPTIEPGDLVAYLAGVHHTADTIARELQSHGGNNWYVSMARALYVTAVYLPELSEAAAWEPFAVRSVEWFLRTHFKGDQVYREPTFHYQAYVADLANTMDRMARVNGRTLPATITRPADWIADSLFATRMPNLEPALVGDANHARSGFGAIANSGERNDWDDFTWVATRRAEGTVPTQGSTIYPISFAVQRSGWDEDARYMLINNQNTNYTASHRHPDDLSLVMAAYGRPLIVDPGAADYSSDPTSVWMRYTTEAHNTVEVDGEPQEAGVTRASWVWRSNAGLDLYRGEAHGYRPVIHDRVVYFIKPGFWVVSDAMTGAQDSHDYRQLWHFPGDPVTVDPQTQVATVGFDTVPGADPVAGVQLVPVADESAEVTGVVHDHGAVRVGEDVLTDVDFLSFDWSATGQTGLDTVIVPGAAGAAPDVTAERIELGVEHSVATAMTIDLPESTGTFYLSREEVPSERTFGTARTDAETAYLERGAESEVTRYSLTAGTALEDQGESLIDASAPLSDLSVDLAGGTARLSLGDPFTGTLSFHAPQAETVLMGEEEIPFTRDGDLVTVEIEPSSDLEPVLEEDFDESALESTLYDFSDGSLQGWQPVGGSWEAGGPDGGLAQVSADPDQSIAVQQDVPDDVIVSAQITPGTRAQATARTGLVFRYHDARNYYRANVLNGPDGVLLQLVKVFNGASEVLDETDLAINADATHTLTVSAVGRHLRASVGDTSVSADDSRLPTGAAGAYTHRRAATFTDITVTEALDQDHWQGVAGDVALGESRIRLTPTEGRAQVTLASTVPARFSQTCDYEVSSTLAFDGVGAVGFTLRDSAHQSYGYRIHVGRTSRGTRYASVIREAHRSGPVTVESVSLGHPLRGPVELGATIHGDRITVTVDGEQVLQARDTLVRSGGVGLQASTEAYYEDLTVARHCDGNVEVFPGPGPQDPGPGTDPQYPAWEAGAKYGEGDRITYASGIWQASWWTRNQQPGDPYGPWQQIATTESGSPIWTPSRIFLAGEEAEHEGERYRAQWWTRNQEPGAPNGPWRRLE